MHRIRDIEQEPRGMNLMKKKFEKTFRVKDAVYILRQPYIDQSGARECVLQIEAKLKQF